MTSLYERRAHGAFPGGAAGEPLDIDGFRHALGAVLHALEAEAAALEAGDASRLEQLATEKRAKLDALEWTVPKDASRLPDDLAEALRRCRDLNSINGEAIAVRLATTRGTLARVTLLAGIDTVALYDAEGRVRNSYAGRRLGSS